MLYIEKNQYGVVRCYDVTMLRCCDYSSSFKILVNLLIRI